MKKLLLIIGVFLLAFHPGIAQTYTSYFTGNSTDMVVNGLGGVCMMGGATENDNAMRWFLQRANGGDVLVIRASGSDGYNSYMFSQLGETVNSVETIVFHSAAASQEAYVQERIQQAEAIWIAGGDQWDYVSYWRDTPVANMINNAISERTIVIGGTSAGMAILGGAYFTAENGTITSSEALSNPYASDLTISNEPFLQVPFMNQVITDTHYDDPDRRGRHLAFLARAYTDYGVPYFGIACEEYTAVTIDPNGEARVFGSYPDFEDVAYFLVPNCSLAEGRPEVCAPGQSLDWDRDGEAVKVFRVNGTPTGLYTFDLVDWDMGSNGDWEDWSAASGLFTAAPGAELDCAAVATTQPWVNKSATVYPNPARGGELFVSLSDSQAARLVLRTMDGRVVATDFEEGDRLQMNLPDNLQQGVYHLEIETASGVVKRRVVIMR